MYYNSGGDTINWALIVVVATKVAPTSMTEKFLHVDFNGGCIFTQKVHSLR